MADIINLSDEELVKGFADGNQRCFNALIDRHKQKIYSFIFLMVRKQELAEDIFQDSFLKVHSSIKDGKYAESGKFASWVMRIAHNLIIDHFRKQKHLPMVYEVENTRDIFNNVKLSDGSIEDQMVYEEVMSDVSALVELLPENQRQVVKMRHYLGMSFKEIADETGVSINTALGRMRYAILNLRKMMEEKNILLTLP